MDRKQLEKKVKDLFSKTTKTYAKVANPNNKSYLGSAVSGAIVGGVVGGTHGLNLKNPEETDLENVGLHMLTGGALGAGVSTLRKYLFGKGVVI